MMPTDRRESDLEREREEKRTPPPPPDSSGEDDRESPLERSPTDAVRGIPGLEGEDGGKESW